MGYPSNYSTEYYELLPRLKSKEQAIIAAESYVTEHPEYLFVGLKRIGYGESTKIDPQGDYELPEWLTKCSLEIMQVDYSIILSYQKLLPNNTPIAKGA